MDAVIIGSPSGLHAKEGIACAEHGLHVLVEKPIDVTIKKADAFISACDTNEGETCGLLPGSICRRQRSLEGIYFRRRNGKAHHGVCAREVVSTT